MESNEAEIRVTQPLMPDLEKFTEMIRGIWDSRWITNMGSFHLELEEALCRYLKVPYISLFTNGTLPLITALQALHITGEVITTPFSFVATTHSLWWNGIKPVFADVDPITGNLAPDSILAAITPRTTAILPVHVYGQPCDTAAIADIAAHFGLKVIYDAAHAFGVEQHGRSVLEQGDLSTLSFHATKVYNTVEGGAMVMHDAATKQRIDYLKNFGFAGETKVVGPGINSKMDELRAAYGLLNLRNVDTAIEKRGEIAAIYRQELHGIEGIRMLPLKNGVRYNHSYFPIFIDKAAYGESRDSLFRRLRESGILSRRYFYPLISDFEPYRALPTASDDNLPNARKLADSVICLPIHHELSQSDMCRIIECLKH